MAEPKSCFPEGNLSSANDTCTGVYGDVSNIECSTQQDAASCMDLHGTWQVSAGIL